MGLLSFVYLLRVLSNFCYALRVRSFSHKKRPNREKEQQKIYIRWVRRWPMSGPLPDWYTVWTYSGFDLIVKEPGQIRQTDLNKLCYWNFMFFKNIYSVVCIRGLNGKVKVWMGWCMKRWFMLNEICTCVHAMLDMDIFIFFFRFLKFFLWNDRIGTSFYGDLTTIY